MILMGPPGSGKTSALATAMLENIKENNLNKHNFLVLAYTHSSLRALVSKLRKFELDIKNSTIHSLAFSLCPRIDLYSDDDDNDVVVSVNKIADFFSNKGLIFEITEYSEDPLSLFDAITYTRIANEQIGNRLYDAIRYIRHTVTSFEAFRYSNYWETEDYKLHFYKVYTTHCMKAFKLNLDVDIAYSIFCEYLEFLYESFKYDFEKMIEVAIVELLNNRSVKKIKDDGVKIIIVDEFQDMTNLMLLFVLCLSNHFDVWVAGDLDQTIYDFAGVDRSFILQSLRKICSWIVQLDVSHRVPEVIFKKGDLYLILCKTKINFTL